MEDIELLAKCLTYMEQHLRDDMKTIDIAKECACSKSTLEKMFNYVYHISVHDYIIRRRMMKAAKMLQNENASILSVALEYGYNSNEAFTRAFKKVWNMNPSEFRGSNMPEIFPRYMPTVRKEDDCFMGKKVDISELYDLFLERKNCYFVCCDIKSLIPINEISRKAGDLAILTSMQRMADVAGAEDIVFRIGGDEFCMLTASEDEAYAKGIMEEILSHNGETIHSDGVDIPLSLYVGIMKFAEKHLKYDELFAKLHAKLGDTKIN